MDDPRARQANYVLTALDRFAEYGEREAIASPERSMTYADLCRETIALAAVLRRRGIPAGAAIAILAGNRPETMTVQFAAHLLGCRTVWIAGYTPIREQHDYLARAKTDYFIYDTMFYAERGAELAKLCPDGTVFCLGADGLGPDLLEPLPADAMDMAALLVDGSAEITALTADVVTAPQSVFYTGGTTGSPKLVLHEHRFFLALLAIGAAWLASGAPALRHLAVTGFQHVSGQMTNLLMLFTGGVVVLRNPMDPATLLEVIGQERIMSTLVTPVQLYNLLDHPATETADLSSLLLLNVGGGPVFPTRLRQAVERFGPRMRMTYGLSEASFITEYRGVPLDPEHPERLRSCGYVFADSRVEIRGEHGAPLPAGEIGEVWTAGSLVMSGYWDDPELTGETLVDGWLRTGDLGYLDADGFLYLVDRSKDMIVTGLGALNVFSKPVEDALASHPQVRLASVIGVPDAEIGEAVYAYVVTTLDATVTEAELRALVTEELSDYQAPRTVEFVDTLPLTGMGKVDKKALRARHVISAELQ